MRHARRPARRIARNRPVLDALQPVTYEHHLGHPVGQVALMTAGDAVQLVEAERVDRDGFDPPAGYSTRSHDSTSSVTNSRVTRRVPRAAPRRRSGIRMASSRGAPLITADHTRRRGARRRGEPRSTYRRVATVEPPRDGGCRAPPPPVRRRGDPARHRGVDQPGSSLAGLVIPWSGRSWSRCDSR